jgi:competence protein ComFB
LSKGATEAARRAAKVRRTFPSGKKNDLEFPGFSDILKIVPKLGFSEAELIPERGRMAFEDEYDFDLLKNEAETLVIHELERQLGAYTGEVCRCNDCVVDMAAAALNSVKPLYRFSLLGTQYAVQAMNEKTYADSVQRAVARAIEKVRENPGHD